MNIHPLLSDEDPRSAIARLEGEIEDLRQALERCRKIELFAKVALAGTVLWTVAALVGAVGFNPTALLAAIAAGIGGIVLLGSNRSTADQTSEALQAAEAQRSALIGSIELRLVDGADAPIIPRVSDR